ncbi:hypothetical protein DM02DRAFT_722620 [Periconia macrospinosa]|uniref:CorA-like transporter domain-containing protein n=1 Tax=Periconia macrospinosa TaxID=97972 RepID=A0A2V1EFR2_9PLEO|nr:hypothetical protein DM02DRAFT_722620 [Periconia macrospinosa]
MQANSDAIFILRQDYSWGRFNISAEMFNTLASSISMFPPFMDFLSTFGFKLRAEDENFQCYHKCITRESSICDTVEFMYNIRYPAKHGRNIQDPWSIRNTAVYQKYNCEQRSCIWVMLQPSEVDYQLISRWNEHSQDSYYQGKISSTIRLSLLWNAAHNWRPYMNYLESELSTLEEKALFSKVDEKTKIDFSVAFSDNQNIQHLRQRMRATHSALSATLDVTRGYEQMLCGNKSPIMHAYKASMKSSLRSYQAYLRNYIRTARNLLDSSTEISNILVHMLDYRNDDVLIRTNEASHANSEHMRTIAAAAHQENKAIVALAEKSSNDSRVIRILTFVTIFYLPASLAASIFSSDLIQLNPPNEPKSQEQGDILHVRKEIWILPALSVGLLAGTFLVIFIWTRMLNPGKFRGKKRFHIV